LELEIERDGSGWQAFRKAVAIRNRITHPREIRDLLITDAELEDVTRAYHWFTYTVVNNLQNAVVELRKRVGENLTGA
jgi:hypothetical protein